MVVHVKNVSGSGKVQADYNLFEGDFFEADVKELFGGIQIKISQEDEFGNESHTTIVLDKCDVAELKKRGLV